MCARPLKVYYYGQTHLESRDCHVYSFWLQGNDGQDSLVHRAR